MKKISLLIVLCFLFILSFSQKPIEKKLTTKDNQSQVVYPTVIKKAKAFAISGPLNEISLSEAEIKTKNETPWFGREDKKINPNIKPPDFENMPPDPGMQLKNGNIKNSKGIINNYDGQSSGSFPPDCNGDVGVDYFFQTVNVTYAIYDKATGTLQANGNLNDIFNSSLPGAGCNDGDPIILYDEQANRWFFAEFSLCSTTDYMLIAVSQTSDPTGSWYSWSYDVDDMPDYMKFGIWQDGYYMATNTSGGNDVYVFERSAMLTGDPNAQMIAFSNPNRPSTFDGFHCIMPCDNDGPWAPSGTPGTYITVADDGQSNPADELWIYELDVDWATPSNSTFQRTQTLGVNSFSGNFNSSWNNIPQPNTTQKLDAISTVLMFRAQYRNFSGVEKIVVSHTIAESSTEGALRWYILERNGGNWYIDQQGTYNPNGTNDVSRWLPDVAMNGIGQVAMGYSISSPSNNIYPGIRIVGRSSCAPDNTMDISEFTIVDGGTYQSSYNRWGDYASMSVDPEDDFTFWYTNEYMNSSITTKESKIVEFQLDEACNPPSISTVSPNSLYEDRGKEITITGSDLLGANFDIGGITGSVVSNDGSTAVVDFPASNYSNTTLTVQNAAGSDTYSMTVNTRNTIPVVAGAGSTSDNHPTIQSAVDGLHAWYGTTSFGAGDLPGTKTIQVYSGTYSEGITLNSDLSTTSSETLIIEPASGEIVTVNAAGNNYGFDLSTVDYVTLKGFTVHNADLDNIFAQGNNVTISHNKTYGSVGGSGIKAVVGAPFSIQNNLSYSNFKYGIHINANGAIVKNNTTDDNGGEYSPATGVQIYYEDVESGATDWQGTDTWYTFDAGDPAYYVSATHTMGANDFIDVYISKTDPVDISAYKNITLSFYVRSYIASSIKETNYFEAAYSFDGTNWTTFENLNTGSSGISSFAQYSVSNLDVSGTENNLYIRFRCDINRKNFMDNVSDEYWMIDDIEVIGDEAASSFKDGSGLYVEGGSNSDVQNNIFVAKTGDDAYYALKSETGVTVISDYNTYYTTNTNLFDYNGTVGNTGPMGPNDLTSNPLFVGSGDYHILSTNDSYHAGEWPPLTATSGTWTTDGSTSPALDAGNPADPYSNEPVGGTAINQGAYGNTVQASKSGAACTYPTTQASNFSATPDVNSIDISWTRGDGDNVIVLAHENSAVDTDPSDGVSYTANATFSSGDEIGTGNFVVYIGSGTSETVTGLNSSTTYYFAVYEFNNSGYCYLTPALTGNATTNAPPTYNWTGATDADWQTTSNWSSALIPSLSDDVTIPDGCPNYPVIDDGTTTAECNNLTIEANANISIATNGQMSVAGAITNNAGNSGIVIQSDASGTGSLIQNSGSGVSATVNQFFEAPGRAWHMLGTPISDATVSVFPNTTYLYFYDESIDDYWTGASYDSPDDGWTNYTSGNLDVGKGYLYNYFENTLTFIGLLNTSTAGSNIQINYTDNGGTAPNGSSYEDFDGWNFISNPFTSAIDWTQVDAHAANLYDAIYVWDDDAGTYKSYVNGTDSWNGASTNGGSQYIPAMQGFFVKVNESLGGATTLNIPPSARIHNSQAFWKNGNITSAENYLSLNISVDDYNDETVVRFLDAATNSMDNGLDAFKLFSHYDYVPQIYTKGINESAEYSINSLEKLYENESVSVPLKIFTTNDEFTLSVNEFKFNDIKVYLKDNANGGTYYLLNKNFQYKFYTTTPNNTKNRFELIFHKRDYTNIINPDNYNITIYPNPTTGNFYLRVENYIGNYKVKINSITGKTVYENKFSGKDYQTIKLDENLSGIYFITIILNEDIRKYEKIIIK